jgi:L-cysteine:1D-myo-inositol 2-amino-2-deoxy-alpha-D-glucopyranoside ligase
VRLYDETSRQLREVEIRPRMTIYVCGITPYDSAHIGHAFTYVHFDVLARYLRSLGVEVVHAQNVTDVDDDILRVAEERGEDFMELGRRETAAFEREMRAIGVQPPTHTPRATGFVPDMIDEVRALVEAGCGYERDGTVYFRVAADPGYGRLSGLTREEMLPLAAERGGHPEDPNKDDPLDFVLWQRSAPGEPWWDSPWGRGRPGWHIECSTMARRLLGQPVDVHGGGTDLIFPHHESELAQAEGVPGRPRPFVRQWMHTGTVHMDDEKMSKSLGNLVFVRAGRLRPRGRPGRVLRGPGRGPGHTPGAFDPRSGRSVLRPGRAVAPRRRKGPPRARPVVHVQVSSPVGKTPRLKFCLLVTRVSNPLRYAGRPQP